ncbi:hypothetical protein [Micromonospora sp. NPDC023737]|uniref:hypothetical protein n=1 Tax=unclassified Micromonospora TaxID=2617518 RepID=UPI0033D795CD
MVQTVRVDFGNISPAMASPQALSLRHPVAATLAWVALTLAVWRCRKAISR